MPTDRDLLLVIDVQNDFCPGGALAVAGGDQVVPVINALSRRFAQIALTQDWHPADHLSFAAQHPGRQPFETIALPYGEQTLWPAHCVQDTPDAAFHAGLALPQAELVLRKGFRRAIDSYSAFRENDRKTATGLAGYLRERGIERIYLAGLATDYCVAYSALDAVELGFAAIVIEDACRAIDLGGSLAQAIERLRGAGVGFARAAEIGR
jgi:nicotinamidase/pyrazinamidase